MPSANPFTTRQEWGNSGHYVDLRTHAQLTGAVGILRKSHPSADLRMYQGSWSHGSLSADTHAGAGAADVGPVGGPGWRETETALRCVGMAAYWRNWAGNVHCHALSIGNPYLAPWAKVQVAAYFDGYDGLGWNARAAHDSGTRLYHNVTWESYLEQHKNVPDPSRPATEELTMKGFWRAKDTKLAAGTWAYVPINDGGDVSFATAPGVIQGVIEPSIKGIPAGGVVYVRLAIDDVDAATGRVRKSAPTETLAKLSHGSEIASVPFLCSLAAPGKGLARRARVQMYASKPVVIDRIRTAYTKTVTN